MNDNQRVLGVWTVTGEDREYIEMFEDLHLLWSPSSEAFSELVAIQGETMKTQNILCHWLDNIEHLRIKIKDQGWWFVALPPYFHRVHLSWGFIAEPAGQLNMSANRTEFWTIPLTLASLLECTNVSSNTSKPVPVYTEHHGYKTTLMRIKMWIKAKLYIGVVCLHAMRR